MKAVKVEYTVRSEYAATNAENISQVMRDLRKINPSGLQYSSFLKEDKKSFVHFVMAKDEEAEKVLTDLPSFKNFQAALKASNPETPPKVEKLALVGTSIAIFL